MTTIKAYTTIEQSKKLADILPLESADMYWDYDVLKHEYYPMVMDDQFDDTCICAWSLAALLNVLPTSLNTSGDGKWNAMIPRDGKMMYVNKDNPVDACYEMVIKLHELNLL